MKRVLLARSSTVATRERVYRIPDGLEVDEFDNFSVRRWRVLFEDVILITRHRYRGVWFLVITGVAAALFGVAAVATAMNERTVGLVLGAVTAGPMLLAFLLRLFFGVNEIDVYSRRSRATLRFMAQENRARRVMKEIADAVRERQQPAGAKMAEREGFEPSVELLGPTAV